MTLEAWRTIARFDRRREVDGDVATVFFDRAMEGSAAWKDTRTNTDAGQVVQRRRGGVACMAQSVAGRATDISPIRYSSPDTSFDGSVTGEGMEVVRWRFS